MIRLILVALVLTSATVTIHAVGTVYVVATEWHLGRKQVRPQDPRGGNSTNPPGRWSAAVAPIGNERLGNGIHCIRRAAKFRDVAVLLIQELHDRGLRRCSTVDVVATHRPD
jgi:hypothetical protein